MIKIKFKDKIFNSKDSINKVPQSFYDQLYLIKQTSNARYNSDDKVWIIEAKVSNYKIIKNIFEDDLLIYVKELIESKKKDNDTQKKISNDNQKKINSDNSFLYKFQAEAVERIINTDTNGFLLGFSMGLGKTLTAIISAIEYHKKYNSKHSKIFIIAPAPLLKQWQEEIKKWTNLDSEILSGTKAKRLKLYTKGSLINIISYDTFKLDFKNIDIYNILKASFAIFDESSKLKNKKSARYKAVNFHKDNFSFKLFLSGTPVSKALVDINNVIELIQKGLAGPLKNYCIYETKTFGWGRNATVINELIGYKNLDVYIKKINPVYERKTQEDIGIQLPQKNITRINVSQTLTHKKIKEEILNELTPFTGFSFLSMLDSNIMNLLVSEAEKIELIEDTFPNKEKIKEPKLEVLSELIEEINDKTLIFTKYIQSTRTIKEYLHKNFPKKKIIIVDSGTKDKDTIKNNFNNITDATDKNYIDIVIATETWAEGISLENIDYLINYDITVSVDKYLQKIDRICRINSKNPKFIYNLVGDIIEIHIMDLLEEKLKLIEQITEGKAGEFTDDDIKKEVLKKPNIIKNISKYFILKSFINS